MAETETHRMPMLEVLSEPSSPQNSNPYDPTNSKWKTFTTFVKLNWRQLLLKFFVLPISISLNTVVCVEIYNAKPGYSRIQSVTPTHYFVENDKFILITPVVLWIYWLLAAGCIFLSMVHQIPCLQLADRYRICRFFSTHYLPFSKYISLLFESLIIVIYGNVLEIMFDVSGFCGLITKLFYSWITQAGFLATFVSCSINFYIAVSPVIEWIFKKYKEARSCRNIWNNLSVRLRPFSIFTFSKYFTASVFFAMCPLMAMSAFALSMRYTIYVFFPDVLAEISGCDNFKVGIIILDHEICSAHPINYFIEQLVELDRPNLFVGMAGQTGQPFCL